MSETRELIDAVARARREYLACVRDLTAEQGDWRASDGEWSIAEITEHLVHAEQGGISLIWTAAEGVRRGRPEWTGDPPHRGLSIETIVERTWQPKETAPEGARPDWGGPLSLWVAALKCCEVLLEALPQQLEGLSLSEVIYPHPISGPLDARQRLEFLRFHIDRHRSQVERMKGSAGFPAG